MLPRKGVTFRALTVLSYLVILQVLCSVSKLCYCSTNLLSFLPHFCVCTHMYIARNTCLGKDCSKSLITEVTSICSFVGFMENSCFSFMSTYSICCCSENRYLNRNRNTQCYSNAGWLRNPKNPPSSFVPTMGFKELFEKAKLTSKNVTF